MNNKWYLKTWLICILFFFWFLFIPLIAGIILLLLKLRNERALATEYENLVEQNDSYEKLLTPELKDAANLDMHIKSLHKEEQQIETNIDSLKQRAFNLENQIKEKQNNMIVLDEEIAIQEFIDIPDAEQYRVSKKMRENKDNAAVL